MTLSCRLLFNSSNQIAYKGTQSELSLIHLEWYINNERTLPNDLQWAAQVYIPMSIDKFHD
ncbi:hypothetical protein VCHE16_2977 [Vibrio paracholerae HE-16]|uniref:Uncharacterized protein n=3 Tax=Vibrio TaxID=662 RepID=A0AAX1QXH9_9VIBR|nr:hypothetical protein [Vibrio cholerae]EGS57361.1 hypothetical protein VCHE09_2628 [Vibrio paracholerae HE-09]EKG85335.1 hypothetical protein VCHE16_2977 [Vibrio paracholerae HE-16]ORP25047.1 hypothetical protein B7953_03625 [Vibrio paracholerae]NAO57606.1 hypothetical protein [Vibrio cholerae]